MSDEPRFHPRRVYIAGPVSPPLGEKIHVSGGVYFSAAVGGHVCLVPEMEPTPLAIVGELAPVIDRSVLAKLQLNNLEHLEHRMITTAARPVPADAAFVHQGIRGDFAAYEIRTRDRRQFKAWSVFFFVDVKTPRRRVVHCFIQPCTPGGGLEVDCRASQPFKAANESWADHARDVKHAWGMLISYRAVACETEHSNLGAAGSTPQAQADDSSGDGRFTSVQRDESNILKCTRIGALPSVEPSLHLGLVGALDFVRGLRVFDADLCVELPLRGFHWFSLSHTKASDLLEHLSQERLIRQALTQASVWRHYRAASCVHYLTEMVKDAEAYHIGDRRAATHLCRVIGPRPCIWTAKASCFPDHLNGIGPEGLAAGAAVEQFGEDAVALGGGDGWGHGAEA